MNEESWYEAVQESKKVDLSNGPEDKFKSYDVPKFVTERKSTAAYLLAKGFTPLGVSQRGGSNYSFAFAVRPGNEVGKAARAFESGKAGVAEKAMQHAEERLQAMVFDFEHNQILLEQQG